jgi:hypothetical protein
LVESYPGPLQLVSVLVSLSKRTKEKLGATDLMAYWLDLDCSKPQFHTFTFSAHRWLLDWDRMMQKASRFWFFYNFKIMSLKSSIPQPQTTDVLTVWMSEIMTAGNPNHLLATLLLPKGFTLDGLLYNS